MDFKLLLRHITPHRRVLAAIAVLLLASAGTALAQPWLAGRFTEQLLSPAVELHALRSLLTLWSLLIVARAFLGFATQYLIGTTGEQITAELRTRLFQHLQALPLAYHRQHRSGELLALLGNDAEQVSRFVTSTVVQLLPLCLTFTGAMAMMILLDSALAIAIALFVPVLVLCLKLVGRRIRPLSRAWVEAYSRLMAFLNENLGMQAAIKSFSRAPLESVAFHAHNGEVVTLSRQRLLLQSLLAPAVGLLASIGVLLLLWLGSQRIASGNLQPSELVSLLLYALMLVQPLRGLANVYGSVQVTRGAAERIIEFFNQRAEPADEGKAPLAVQRGDIWFHDIGFAYDERDRVLDNFNLRIAAGETIAITGPNGAGKSTLALLLLRLADPQSGTIEIDGVDISTVTLASLRRQIGLVAQHTLLLDASVADNIAYGRPLASRRDIEAAARLAQADDFIASLPQGYDTLIGEQGLRLSGGQRQRIALARALLLQPPILILDEATSMFDPQGEARFIKAFAGESAKRTVILITHRAASLELADRVVEIGEQPSDDATGRLRSQTSKG